MIDWLVWGVCKRLKAELIFDCVQHFYVLCIYSLFISFTAGLLSPILSMPSRCPGPNPKYKVFRVVSEEKMEWILGESVMCQLSACRLEASSWMSNAVHSLRPVWDCAFDGVSLHWLHRFPPSSRLYYPLLSRESLTISDPCSTEVIALPSTVGPLMRSWRLGPGPQVSSSIEPAPP